MLGAGVHVRLDLHDVEAGNKGFVLYNRSAVVDCDDCGLNKVTLGRKISALVSCCAPVQHLGQKRTLVKLKVGNFT